VHGRETRAGKLNLARSRLTHIQEVFKSFGSRNVVELLQQTLSSVIRHDRRDRAVMVILANYLEMVKWCSWFRVWNSWVELRSLDPTGFLNLIQLGTATAQNSWRW
jgi:hypothetical protein